MLEIDRYVVVREDYSFPDDVSRILNEDLSNYVQVPLHLFRKFLWPVIPEEQQKPLRSPGKSEVVNFLQTVQPEYSDETAEMVANSKLHPNSIIEVGKFFNINSLLSCNGEINYLFRNSGERVVIEKKTFERKYVMVCCFHVPVFREDHFALSLQSLVSICSDLYLRGDFEMVVVVKMNNLANSVEVFNHFMSGFPPCCLVVPFKDSKRRDFICKYLDLQSSRRYDCHLLVDVDVDGDVSRRRVLCDEFPKYTLEYGAEAFPYTRECEDRIFKANLPLELWDPSWNVLEQLLGCDDPSLVLYKINPDPAGGREGEQEEEVSILELKEKLVGLYLCFDGTIIETLDKVYHECRTRNLDLEIVVVYLPFGDCLDPGVFQANVDALLRKRNISSWWRFPFNNSASRRLLRIVPADVSDALVIVGPHGDYVDPYGDKVMRDYGVEAYPFTRKSLFQRELNKIRALTLESLLVYGPRDYVLRHDGDERIAVPVAALRGRNILLYLDSLDQSYFYDKVFGWYHEIKAKDPDFEVVFVRQITSNAAAKLEEEDPEYYDKKVSAMPWLVCPFDLDHSAFVQKKLLTNVRKNTLAEFNVDGQICSVDAHKLLIEWGPDAFPFADHIRQEVIFRFRDVDEYMESMRLYQVLN